MIGTVEFLVSGIIAFIAQDLHISIAIAGQLVSTYAFAYAIGTPILIAWTKKVKRKKLLISALFSFAIGNLLTFLDNSFVLLIIARLLLGVSGGVFTVVAMGMGTKLVPFNQRGNAIGIISMGFTSALVLGVPLGTILSKYLSWKYSFLFIGAFTLVTALFLSLTVPELENDQKEYTPFWKQFTILQHKSVWIAFIVSFSMVAGYSIFFTFISPYLHSSANLSTDQISFIFLLAGIASMLGSRIGGYATDRWSTQKTLIYGLLLHALALLTMPLSATSFIGSLITVMIWMIAVNGSIPTQITYLTMIAPKSSEFIIGINISVFQLGAASGSAIGGVFVRYFSLGSISWIAGILVLIGLFVALYVFRSKKISTNIKQSVS